MTRPSNHVWSKPTLFLFYSKKEGASCFLTYPLGDVISLVVLPHQLHHLLHHLLDRVRIGRLTVEVQPHESGHSGQQAGDLLQLLTGMIHAVRPGVIHQENTAGSTGVQRGLKFIENKSHSFLKMKLTAGKMIIGD